MQIRNLQTLTQKYETPAIGALFLIAVVGIYNWVLTPHLNLLAASQRYERAARQRMELSETTNDDVRARRDELESLLAERGNWSNMTFDSAGAEEFLRTLQTLCNEAGCGLVSLNYLQATEFTLPEEPSETESDDETARPPVPSLIAKGAVMAVHGHYESIVRLIEILQSHPTKVWIDRLQMTALRPNAETVTCELVIAIYVTSGKEMEQDE